MRRTPLHDTLPLGHYVIDSFRPEDAPGVVRLYQAVYGEAYPMQYVYDADELVRRNARGDVYYAVGRTSAEDIVGLCALFRNPPGRRIMEAGSWIVLPEYRNSLLAFQLAEYIHQNTPEHFGLDVLFSQSVCDQLVTQKMACRFKAIPCAIELEALPARTDARGSDSGAWISLLDAMTIFRDRPQAVHLPARYATVLHEMYAAWNLAREEVRDSGPDRAVSHCAVLPVGNAQLVRMTVDEPGFELGARIRRMEEEHPRCHAWQCVLPLWRPGITHAVETARQAGYFLAGLLPGWADKDALLLQKLSSRPDFSILRLYTDAAKRLLDAIVVDYESLELRG